MLKIKNNNINIVLLKYFLLFSIFILTLLWIFQGLFFNSIYKEQKIKDIKEAGNLILKNKNNDNLINIINDLSINKEINIEIDNNYKTIYKTNYMGKSLLINNTSTQRFKFDFINSNNSNQLFNIKDSKYDYELVLYAVKLSNDNYLYIDTTITPIEGIIKVINKQLIVLSLIIITISFILAYFISLRITNPIKKISNDTKELATGNYSINFKEDFNIDEIDELSKTLNYTKDELSKIDNLRRDLIANVSHDLKTPLTMIKAYAEMAKDLHKNNKKKQENDMNVIISETDRLTNLVNDILELSKVSNNINELDISSFDLIEITNTIISKFKLSLEKEKYNFIFNCNKDSLIINADKKKIEQVIYNLISNAVNYTGDDNTVIIEINYSKGKIKVSITDTGKGIKKEDIPYIFNKYYKNDKNHKRDVIGTGLGLSIVKNILELHNYKYGVNSTINKGTTFYFIIKKNT